MSNPSFIYFKELDIDSDNNFHLNFSKENQIEAVTFNNDYEYAVTGLSANVTIPKDELIRITTKEKVEKAMEIKQIVDDYVEPDLSLYIVNTETETVKFPFTKKNATDLPPLKFDYFDYSAQKTKQVSVYDFEGHLKKFGFEWEDTPSNFKYTIKKVNDKIEKKDFFIGDYERKNRSRRTENTKFI